MADSGRPQHTFAGSRVRAGSRHARRDIWPSPRNGGPSGSRSALPRRVSAPGLLKCFFGRERTGMQLDGITVTSVTPGCAADLSGVKSGWTIATVNGTPAPPANPKALYRALKDAMDSENGMWIEFRPPKPARAAEGKRPGKSSGDYSMRSTPRRTKPVPLFTPPPKKGIDLKRLRQRRAIARPGPVPPPPVSDTPGTSPGSSRPGGDDTSQASSTRPAVRGSPASPRSVASSPRLPAPPPGGDRDAHGRHVRMLASCIQEQKETIERLTKQLNKFKRGRSQREKAADTRCAELEASVAALRARVRAFEETDRRRTALDAGWGTTISNLKRMHANALRRAREVHSAEMRALRTEHRKHLAALERQYQLQSEGTEGKQT